VSILWTIIIGFLARVIARFFHPGNKYEPKGFIFTTLLGIVGAFVATYLGQAVGWYKAGEGAGFIGAGTPQPWSARSPNMCADCRSSCAAP
jgi:uncharacterized membrane protein YeaQ/YmgE (transglycosylase-associated protein family)